MAPGGVAFAPKEPLSAGGVRLRAVRALAGSLHSVKALLVVQMGLLKV
jgi:hypothetical protein